MVLRQAGIAYNQFSPRSAGIDFYGDNLFTSAQLWQKDRQLVEKFRAASLRGWAYAMQHPAEVIAYMQHYPSDSSALWLAEAAAMQPLLQTDLIAPGYTNPARWHHIAGVYQQQGLLKTVPDLAGFLYQVPAPFNLAADRVIGTAGVIAGTGIVGLYHPGQPAVTFVADTKTSASGSIYAARCYNRCSATKQHHMT